MGSAFPVDPWGGPDTVLVSTAHPDWCCHPRRQDCQIEVPHHINGCGAFREVSELGDSKPRTKSNDWDGEPTPILPDIQVEDTPTLIRLPNGRAWRRRIGFTGPTRQDV